MRSTRWALVALLLVITLLALPATAAAERWLPKPTTAAWQWQLQGKIDTSIPAPVYEVDGFETPARTVAKLHRQGRFDAVEPDNLAGYENNTGFPLSGRDQLRFNRWVAREVHRRGMSVALKNDPAQVRRLVGDFDFAVVEECFAYDECGMFSPFVEAGKAVFVAEYEKPLTSICAEATELNFSVIAKDYDLFAKPWRPCI